MKTEKLGGVAGGEGECGDDVAGWLVRERRSLLSHLTQENYFTSHTISTVYGMYGIVYLPGNHFASTATIATFK